MKPKGDKFLKDGGFTRRYQLEQQKPVEVGGTLDKLAQLIRERLNQQAVFLTVRPIQVVLVADSEIPASAA